MILLPDVWWPTALLALVLLVDAAMSVRPPAFIRDCLDAVAFPRDWWWTLIVIRTLAAVGLIVGIWMPGVAFSATVAVIAYFCSAAAAHLRAGNTGRAFWINCLGMLLLSIVVLVLSVVL